MLDDFPVFFSLDKPYWIPAALLSSWFFYSFLYFFHYFNIKHDVQKERFACVCVIFIPGRILMLYTVVFYVFLNFECRTEMHMICFVCIFWAHLYLACVKEICICYPHELSLSLSLSPPPL
jgi:hypothetical protein